MGDEIERCVCNLQAGQVYEFDAYDLNYCVEICCGREISGIYYSFKRLAGVCVEEGDVLVHMSSVSLFS